MTKEVPEFIVRATSTPSGINIICRIFEGSESIVSDIYIMTLHRNPETMERKFVFAPLNPLTRFQCMRTEEFERLATTGAFTGIHTPDEAVIQRYLDFVDTPGNREFIADCYTTESGPSKDWVDKNVPPEGPLPAVAQRDGNLLLGPWLSFEVGVESKEKE